MRRQCTEVKNVISKFLRHIVDSLYKGATPRYNKPIDLVALLQGMSIGSGPQKTCDYVVVVEDYQNHSLFSHPGTWKGRTAKRTRMYSNRIFYHQADV